MIHGKNMGEIDYEDYKFIRVVWEHWGFWWNMLGLVGLAAGATALILFNSIVPNKFDGVVYITACTTFFLGGAVSNFCYRKIEAIEALIDNPDTLDVYRTKFSDDKLMRTKSPTREKAEKTLVYGICITFFSFCAWLALKLFTATLQWPSSLQVLMVVTTLFAIGASFSSAFRSVFLERIDTFGGKEGPSRLSTRAILTLAFLCIPMGVWLLNDEVWFGATLILTLCPCLFLYPLIRGLFYGGKDSIAGVVTTVVVEEVLKGAISSSMKKAEEKRRRR